MRVWIIVILVSSTYEPMKFNSAYHLMSSLL